MYVHTYEICTLESYFRADFKQLIDGIICSSKQGVALIGSILLFWSDAVISIKSPKN
jgi:threonine aldolase